MHTVSTQALLAFVAGFLLVWLMFRAMGNN